MNKNNKKLSIKKRMRMIRKKRKKGKMWKKTANRMIRLKKPNRIKRPHRMNNFIIHKTSLDIQNRCKNNYSNQRMKN